MDKQYSHYLKMIEDFLTELWKNDDTKLAEAMRYSLLSGGKRIRPVIALAFCEMCGGKLEDALPAACAIELIHTYSLIHDDLPCMDNDDFRRGKPANHKVYGETMALLAGDGLLSYAMLLLGQTPMLAEHIGYAAFNMVRGQAMEFEGCTDIMEIYRFKTGALFRGAAEAGCIVAGAETETMCSAKAYADAIGLAFQYRDDMLDGEGNCQDEVESSTAAAKVAIASFENNEFLLALADSLAKRDK
jgi:geranylgeranyl diphosphate synthase type II